MDRHELDPRGDGAQKAAAQRSKPGQWIIVAGGWTEQQFVEKRRPTQVELLAAAPDNPVYVQSFYSAALLTPAGYKALNITSDADVPPSGKIERAADGTATGWILGDNPTISGLFDKLPLPTFDESVEGTRQFFRELNRLGITGVSDPGGFNLTAASYQPLFKLWEDGALSVRVVYSLFAQRRGRELEDDPGRNADVADGLRRRLAAFQRHRRERRLGHVQQRQPH